MDDPFRSARRLFLILALVGTAGLASPHSARGQQPTLEEARRLQERGDLPAATLLLTRRVEANPQDADAWRLLGQTLYWSGRNPESRRAYEEALRVRPADPGLRLEYGRMLVETGRHARASRVLETIRSGSTAAEAEALLGTSAYWRGDLTAARRRFRAALALSPAHEAARRQLTEIDALVAPWLETAASHRSDDQPLHRSAARIAAGWHLTPLNEVEVRLEPQRFGGAAASTLAAGEIAWRGFRPGPRLDASLALGGLRGPERSEWTGRAALGLRLPRGTTLSLSADRAAYLWTVASIDSPVMTDAARGVIGWQDPSGWIGESGYAVTRFEDMNRVRSAHAWLLAPIVRSDAVTLHGGYAFAWEDALESRFDPGGVEPRYAPYYTPEQVRVHSLAGALAVKAGGIRVHAGGAYGFHALEHAPTRSASSAVPIVEWADRRYTPWNARGEIAVPFAEGASVRLGGEHARTAFYRVTTVSAGVRYAFRSRGLP